MSRNFVIRTPAPCEREAIRAVEEAAFGQPDEATLSEALIAAGDDVLGLVAEKDGLLVGHILFSRLIIKQAAGGQFAAVALAPLGVLPAFQQRGIGTALITMAHRHLKDKGERLSVVLGDPAYYGRFGYENTHAAGFTSDFQCDALQALNWGEAPTTGQLVYAPAFSGP